MSAIKIICNCGAYGFGKGYVMDGVSEGNGVEIEEMPEEWTGGSSACLHRDIDVSHCEDVMEYEE